MRTTELPQYYLSTAMQAMEQAYAQNQDGTVRPHLSRAIDALHELMQQTAISGHPESDPYEMNQFNSAI